ncbi:hypothetical protein HG531_005611 [Fusarium graminearum]|nr:hypothetical protein HG531_005611 [Fusarium graminearum]
MARMSFGGGPVYANGHPTFLVLLDARRFTVQNFLFDTFFPDDQLAVGQALSADKLATGGAASGSVGQLTLESLDLLSNAKQLWVPWVLEKQQFQPRLQRFLADLEQLVDVFLIEKLALFTNLFKEWVSKINKSSLGNKLGWNAGLALLGILAPHRSASAAAGGTAGRAGRADKEELCNLLEDLEDERLRGERELGIPHGVRRIWVGGHKCQEMIVCGGSRVDEEEIHDEDSLALVPSLGRQFGEPKEEGPLALSRALAEAEEGIEGHLDSDDLGSCCLLHSNRDQVDGHIAHLSGREVECCECTRLHHRRGGLGTCAPSARDPSVRPF